MKTSLKKKRWQSHSQSFASFKCRSIPFLPDCDHSPVTSGNCFLYFFLEFIFYAKGCPTGDDLPFLTVERPSLGMFLEDYFRSEYQMLCCKEQRLFYSANNLSVLDVEFIANGSKMNP